MTILPLPLKVYTYEELTALDVDADFGDIYTWLSVGLANWLQRGAIRGPTTRGFVIFRKHIEFEPAQPGVCAEACCQCQQVSTGPDNAPG